MRFSRQEYWSGISFNWYCHFLLQGIFLTQGSNSLLGSPAWQADSLPLSHLGSSSRLIRHYVMRRFARERVLKSPNLTCAPVLSPRPPRHPPEPVPQLQADCTLLESRPGLRAEVFCGHPRAAHLQTGQKGWAHPHAADSEPRGSLPTSPSHQSRRRTSSGARLKVTLMSSTVSSHWYSQVRGPCGF